MVDKSILSTIERVIDMLPDDLDFDIDDDESDDFEEIDEPDKTYELNNYIDRIRGKCDGLEAVRQSVYHILTTERYKFPIYSWNYGFETRDLLGKPASYVIPTLELRVRDALSVDDRIEDITDFQAEVMRPESLKFSCNCVTKYGEIEYIGYVGAGIDD